MSTDHEFATSPFAPLGLRRVINARGTVTRLGGAPMSAGVIQAMAEASRWTVSLEELHGAACRKVSACCQTEAALVTCGAAAGLMLGAAAILAGWDVRRMDRLPDTRGMANEFLVARSQRNGYDHAVRAAGVRLREVGLDEWTSGAGVRSVEVADYQAAIGPRTAGVFYVLDAQSRPSLSDVVQMAHAKGLPVLVDAAAQWGTPAEVASIVQTGADLIVFSGGKALGGPQSTGILCGRRSLVGSAFLQMMDLDEHPDHWSPPTELVDQHELLGLPRQGIGRMLKVSQEQIVGLLQAIAECTPLRLQEQAQQWRTWLESIQAELVDAHCQLQILGDRVPQLKIRLLASDAATEAARICHALMHDEPPIYVGHGELHRGLLSIHPACLGADSVLYLGQRLRHYLVTT